MTDRITRDDLARMLDGLRRAAIDVGIGEAARWHLEVGSKTYGRAYRLWLKHTDYPAHSGHYAPVVRDFLGMTAREAFDTMSTLRDAFHAVAYVRDMPAERATD